MKTNRIVSSIAVVTLLAGNPLIITSAFAQGGTDDTSTSGSTSGSSSTSGTSGSGTSGSGSTSGSRSSGSGSSTSGTSESGSASTTGTISGSHSGDTKAMGLLNATNHVEQNAAASHALEVLTSKSKSGKSVLKVTKGKVTATTTSADGKEVETELAKSEITLKVKDATGSTHKVVLKHDAENFKLEENGIEVETNLDIEFNEKEQKVGVETEAGPVEFKTLPAEAVAELTDKGVLTSVDKVEVVEAADKTIAAKVTGTKSVKFLGLFPVIATETAQVSLTTDASKVTSKPWFLSVFGFLFQ